MSVCACESVCVCVRARSARVLCLCGQEAIHLNGAGLVSGEGPSPRRAVTAKMVAFHHVGASAPARQSAERNQGHIHKPLLACACVCVCVLRVGNMRRGGRETQ